MSSPWKHKIDPHGRVQLEEGLPAQGINVTLRLASQDANAVQQLEETGLTMHSQIADIIVGHVANVADLQHIAELACVQEVHVSRPLYPDQSNASEKDQ